MRVFRFLFISFIVLSVVAAIGLLIGREALLIWGMSNLRSSVTRMKSSAANLGPLITECQKRGGTELTSAAVDRIQLRFTSDREYQIEAICDRFLLDPIMLGSGALPPLLQKKPGTSGLIWGEGSSAVTLTVGGRQRSLVLENGITSYTNQAVNIPLGNGPITSCQGYGFKCCALESTQGIGDQIAQANDCPRSCFSACVSRPVILSFTSDPFYEPATRVVTVAPGDPVVFAFVVDKGSAKNTTTTIEFGDGQNQVFETTEGEIAHQYTCASATCEFTASITSLDDRQATNMPTSITQIQVVIVR